MKKPFRLVYYTATIISLGWCILTVMVEINGPEKSWDFGDKDARESVLIVYDPDPFYNLDEQVCLAFATVLAKQGMRVKVASVSAAKDLEFSGFNVYVFCANTYNWAPDWALTRYIKEQKSLNKKPVIAVTLGSGSTRISQKKLEQLIIRTEGRIIDSRSFWLMRPNDEAQTKESNVQIALSRVRNWAELLAPKIMQAN